MRIPLGLLMLLAVAIVPARGQAPDEFGFRFPLIQVRVSGDERVLLGAGGCSIEGPGFRLSGDHLVLWCDASIERHAEGIPGLGGGSREVGPDGKEIAEKPTPRTAAEWLGPVIHAAYAIGNVRYERTDEWLTITGHRLLVDFRRDRSLVVKARLEASMGEDPEGRTIPLIVHAEEIRQVAEREFRASSASITTCEFEEPHFRFEADDVRAWATGDLWNFESGDTVLRVGSIPVFWLPLFGARSDGSLRPLRSVRLGRSSRYGYEIETLWGDDILVGEGEDERRWGECNVRLDERTRRGPGGGLDLDYETDSYLGRLRTYYQYDDARKDRITEERVPKGDRGRAWWQHRFEFPADWRLDLETLLESDRAYRSEFWEAEEREDKAPETYVQIRKLHENAALFATGRIRANGHLSRTEYLPRVAGALISEPLAERLLGVDGWRVLLDVDASASEARRKYDDDLDETNTDWIERADLTLGLRSPFGIGPVRISPVAAVRGTAFSETLDDGDAEGRFAAEAGVRADLELHRLFPSVQSTLLDLDGLRHVIDLDLEYLDRGTVTVDPEELVQLDGIDSLDETRVVILRTRNRFQTRRGPRGKVVDALDVEVEAEYYPGWETVRDRRVRGLAFIETRVEAPISETVTFRADADYDAHGHDWLTASAGVRYRPDAVWSASFEQRFIGDNQNLASAWIDVRPTARYGFRGYVRQDVRRGILKRAGLLVRRHAHDWVLEVDLRFNDDLDDFSVLFSISPRGFGGGARPARSSIDDRAMYGEGPE